MKIDITVISDNISMGTLQGEWGLSLLVKYGDKKILVDAGASELFMENMEKLGESIADTDYAILSHAHYDHANGMPAFFEHNSRAKLYLRDKTASDCYDRKFIFRKYIGIPKNMLEEYADRIEKVSDVLKVSEGVHLIPHSTPGLSSVGKRERMYRKTPAGWIADDFAHEQSVIFETDKGLLIINSCSHAGVANILNEVREVFPDKKIYGYIGGFHLFNKNEEEVRRVGDVLKETSMDYICTGHCTKEKAFDILKEQLGDKVEQLHVGLKIVI